ncbi:TetR/AcrR family transcriptional regulator [Cohnella nanjingensis]|uniref:TetR/AcrR family transcriptional regulator n=1 Tax=Cohnella nanjingensis TaxID=1387779 RepID=A0A7X0RWV5_9BACL|nr:TetR/AcrR family transcriptional regulator [Cohnella nanjingensis]MBB6675111.1 TetR/AcrR family transcriptional regulator [Cohnella nanjingensis]
MAVREDRKEQILDKAVAIFAEWGYYKTTTAQVAQAVGVTQPYVFHFFKNKEELYKAVIERSILRLYEAFDEVQAPADRLLIALGDAFMHILETRRDEMLMVMQSHVIAEPSIRELVRQMFRDIHALLAGRIRMAGLPDAEAEASEFIGLGLLITMAEVLGLPELMRFKEE